MPLLAQLNTNIIRTYAIDPTADHSACMKLLNDAGIYVISDLGQPNLSINRDSPQWTVDLFTRYQQVVDALAKYPNVVGFFAGNEVSNSHNNTAASAYVKAAVRDTKQYIKNKKYRWMGVGYAANDDLAIRDDIASYFNCGPTDESIDYFGYNIYSWCGDSDFQKSGYDRLIDFFKEPGPYSAFLMGGGDWGWRENPDPEWQAFLRRLDAYAPWNVGNTSKDAAGARHASMGYWAEDRRESERRGVLWVPVV